MTQSDPRFHQGDRWHEETSAPDWATRVIAAIRNTLRPAPDTVTIQTIHSTLNELVITYRHTSAPGLLGLRRLLTLPPPVGDPADDLAEWLGAWIAEFELIEPPIPRRPDASGISWTTRT